MALWDKIGSTGNVEDRRGLGGGGLAVGGVGGLVIFLLFAFLGSQGIDTSVLQQIVGQSSQQSTEQPAEFAGEDSYEQYAKRVIGSNDELWTAIFAAEGAEYPKPRLVLFRGSTNSGCGVATSAVGPHYCPEDQTIYLDETFFAELKKRYGGSSGDVAQAYVMSHEIGHHVQNVRGTLAQFTEAQQRNPNSANELSVRLELQADCYSGIWMHSLSRTAILEGNEIEQAISAASAVGDDNIMETSGGRVIPENFTHGTSEQRVEWFTKGYKSGTVESCRI